MKRKRSSVEDSSSSLSDPSTRPFKLRRLDPALAYPNCIISRPRDVAELYCSPSSFKEALRHISRSRSGQTPPLQLIISPSQGLIRSRIVSRPSHSHSHSHSPSRSRPRFYNVCLKYNVLARRILSTDCDCRKKKKRGERESEPVEDSSLTWCSHVGATILSLENGSAGSGSSEGGLGSSGVQVLNCDVFVGTVLAATEAEMLMVLCGKNGNGNGNGSETTEDPSVSGSVSASASSSATAAVPIQRGKKKKRKKGESTTTDTDTDTELLVRVARGIVKLGDVDLDELAKRVDRVFERIPGDDEAGSGSGSGTRSDTETDTDTETEDEDLIILGDDEDDDDPTQEDQTSQSQAKPPPEPSASAGSTRSSQSLFAVPDSDFSESIQKISSATKQRLQTAFEVSQVPKADQPLSSHTLNINSIGLSLTRSLQKCINDGMKLSSTFARRCRTNCPCSCHRIRRDHQCSGCYFRRKNGIVVRPIEKLAKTYIGLAKRMLEFGVADDAVRVIVAVGDFLATQQAVNLAVKVRTSYRPIGLNEKARRQLCYRNRLFEELGKAIGRGRALDRLPGPLRKMLRLSLQRWLKSLPTKFGEAIAELKRVHQLIACSWTDPMLLRILSGEETRLPTIRNWGSDEEKMVVVARYTALLKWPNMTFAKRIERMVRYSMTSARNVLPFCHIAVRAIGGMLMIPLHQEEEPPRPRISMLSIGLARVTVIFELLCAAFQARSSVQSDMSLFQDCLSWLLSPPRRTPPGGSRFLLELEGAITEMEKIPEASLAEVRCVPLVKIVTWMTNWPTPASEDSRILSCLLRLLSRVEPSTDVGPLFLQCNSGFHDLFHQVTFPKQVLGPEGLRPNRALFRNVVSLLLPETNSAKIYDLQAVDFCCVSAAKRGEWEFVDRLLKRLSDSTNILDARRELKIGEFLLLEMKGIPSRGVSSGLRAVCSGFGRRIQGVSISGLREMIFSYRQFLSRLNPSWVAILVLNLIYCFAPSDDLVAAALEWFTPTICVRWERIRSAIPVVPFRNLILFLSANVSLLDLFCSTFCETHSDAAYAFARFLWRTCAFVSAHQACPAVNACMAGCTDECRTCSEVRRFLQNGKVDDRFVFSTKMHSSTLLCHPWAMLKHYPTSEPKTYCYMETVGGLPGSHRFVKNHLIISDRGRQLAGSFPFNAFRPRLGKILLDLMIKGRRAPDLSVLVPLSEYSDVAPEVFSFIEGVSDARLKADFIEGVLQLGSPSPEVLALMHSHFLALGDIQQASDCLQKSLSIKPTLFAFNKWKSFVTTSLKQPFTPLKEGFFSKLKIGLASFDSPPQIEAFRGLAELFVAQNDRGLLEHIVLLAGMVQHNEPAAMICIFQLLKRFQIEHSKIHLCYDKFAVLMDEDDIFSQKYRDLIRQIAVLGFKAMAYSLLVRKNNVVLSRMTSRQYRQGTAWIAYVMKIFVLCDVSFSIWCQNIDSWAAKFCIGHGKPGFVRKMAEFKRREVYK